MDIIEHAPGGIFCLKSQGVAGIVANIFCFCEPGSPVIKIFKIRFEVSNQPV